MYDLWKSNYNTPPINNISDNISFNSIYSCPNTAAIKAV